jgi:hypothetical protein
MLEGLVGDNFSGMVDRGIGNEDLKYISFFSPSLK